MDELINYFFYLIQTNEWLLYPLVLIAYAISIGVTVGLVYHIFFRRRIKDYHSNWNTLIEDFEYSMLDFYTQLEQELRSQEIQGMAIQKVKLLEGGIFSNRRKYLRVTWKDFHYDICAAPFGNQNFFVSWWLLYRQTLLQMLIFRIPIVGGWLSRLFYPVTYYKIDTASMLMTLAQASVLKVIDSITKEKGIRIPDDKRKPTIKVTNFKKR